MAIKNSFCVSVILLIIIQTTSAEQEQRSSQKITCGHGKAVSNIEWSQLDSKYKTFKIECVNFTTSCTKRCDWTLNCDTARFGADVYLEGINVLYDPFKKTQPHQHLSWEVCQHDKNVNVPLCPLRDTESKNPPPAVDPRIGLAGLAGLAGLSGIALLMKPRTTTAASTVSTSSTTTTTTTTRPPTCTVQNGICVLSGPVTTQLGTPSAAACASICLGSGVCGAMTFLPATIFTPSACLTGSGCTFNAFAPVVTFCIKQ